MPLVHASGQWIVFPTPTKQLVTWLFMRLDVWITDSFWLLLAQPTAWRASSWTAGVCHKDRYTSPLPFYLWECFSMEYSRPEHELVTHPIYKRHLFAGLISTPPYALLWCRTSLSTAWHFVFGMFWFRISVLQSVRANCAVVNFDTPTFPGTFCLHLQGRSEWRMWSS